MTGLLRRAIPSRPVVVADADPAALGLDTARPHTDRPVDARVEELVGSSPVVVAAGPPGAGATHALARAARFLLGDHLLVLPHGPGEALADLLDRGARGAGAAEVLVWLDDAPRAVLRALAAGLVPPPRVRLLVTAREELLDADVTGDVPWRRRRRLPTVRVPAAGPGETGPRRPDRDRLVEMLCPRPAAGDRAPLLRAALLRTAADWERLAVGRPLPRPVLLGAAADQEILRGRGSTRDDLVGALDALLTGSPSLVVTRPWDGGPDAVVHHAPAPGLAAVADELGPTGAGWELPSRLVEELDARVTDPADRRAVGVLALRRHADALALRLLAHVDPATLSAPAAYRAGLTALESGDAGDARRWFTAVASVPAPSGTATPTAATLAAVTTDAAATGAVTTDAVTTDAADYRARASFWLGLDPDLGLDERRARLTAVVAEGAPADRADAASVLAALEREAGRAGARRHWLRRAVEAARESGDTRRSADALVELAHLEWTGGSLEAARAAFTEAARCGDPECGAEAMMALGTLAAEQGDGETAGTWFRRAGADPAARAGAGPVAPRATEPALTVPVPMPAVALPSPRRPSADASAPHGRGTDADGGRPARPRGAHRSTVRTPTS